MPDADHSGQWPRFLSIPHMRYQNAYVWLVLVSALDIFLTSLVLFVWRGSEVNPVTEAIIGHLGFTWCVAFKLAICVMVIVICEVVGRLSDRAGRRLAITAVCINAFPVVFAFALLKAAGPAPGAEEVGIELAAAVRQAGELVSHTSSAGC